MIESFEPSKELTERSKLATQMVIDFESFLRKQGFLLGCTVLIDLDSAPMSIISGRIPMIVLFGRDMEKKAVVEILQRLGKQADYVMDNSFKVGGDGNVLHNS